MKITLLSIEFAPSIGLRLLQSLLIKENHLVKLVHIPMQRVDNNFIKIVSNELSKFCKNDGLIGISCMANTFIPGSKLVKKLRAKLNIPIIMGGVHPTFKPEECLNFVDYICVGEGEEAILEFVAKLEKKENLEKIQNIWIKKNGKIVKNELRPLVNDLNSLPLPHFDCKDFYVWNKDKIYNLEKNPVATKKFFSFFYSIITSRGCPYRCNYCVNDALCRLNTGARTIRRRSVENLLRELKIVRKKLGNVYINFSDDDFASRRVEELKEFFQKYKREINLPFFCASTPTSLKEEKLKILIDAKMQRLQIGIQSISDEVNKKIYGRPAGKKQILEMTALASKYRKKIKICYDIILDTPWEKEETKIETLRFLFTLKKPHEIWLYSMTLYPGTSFYERAKEEGLLKNEEEEVYNKSFLALKNSSINSLFLLFTKFKVPPLVINLLIFLRRFKLINTTLHKSTYFLLHLQFYLEGFKNSFNRKDFWMFISYLTAPIRLLINFIERKKRTKV